MKAIEGGTVQEVSRGWRSLKAIEGGTVQEVSRGWRSLKATKGGGGGGGGGGNSAGGMVYIDPDIFQYHSKRYGHGQAKEGIFTGQTAVVSSVE